ncbi:MAG: ATP-binding cassette domain-containing protein [Pseudomonadota bacterium]
MKDASHDIPQEQAPQASRANYLKVSALSKIYLLQSFPKRKELKAVDNASFSVAKGEIVGLVGGSGSGKSTLAKMITRQTQPSAGSVSIDGEDWLAHKGEALRQRRSDVQLVFQDPYAALDPKMTLGTSMGAPLAFHGIADADERERRVSAMLNEVGLDPSFASRLPKECSGGQLQRVVIGRALLLEPKLLICDEPTSALDASIKAQVLNLLSDLNRARDLTMLMITHDLRVVQHICARIIVMFQGELVEIGETKQIFEDPRHPYTRALLAASRLETDGLEGAEQVLADLAALANTT